MKNLKSILLPFLAVSMLASCGPNNTSEQQSIQPTPVAFSMAEFLENFTYVGLDGKITGMMGTQQYEQNSKVYISNDEYYIDGISSVHYFKDTDGDISSRYVTYNNELVSVKMTSDSNPVKFNSVISMSNFDVNKFSYDVETNTVIYDVSDDDTSISELILLIDSDFDSFVITLDNNYKPVSAKFTCASYSQDRVTLTDLVYEAAFKTKEELGVPVIEPHEAQHNDELDAFFTSMKAGNYTLTVYSSLVDGGQTPSFEAIVTETGLINRDHALGSSALVCDPDGGLAEAIEINNGDESYLQRTTSPDDSFTLSDYIASFDFSTDLFVKEGNKYHLTDAYYAAINILPDCAFELLPSYAVEGSVYVELLENKAVISYDFKFISSGSLRIEVTNIGTTVFPYDLTDPNQYQTSPLPVESWESLDSDVCFNAFMLLGCFLDEVLPFYLPDGGWDYFDIWEDMVEIDKNCDTLEEAQEYFDSYYFDIAGLLFDGYEEASDCTLYCFHIFNAEDGIQIMVKAEEGFFGDAIFTIYVWPYSAE